MDVVKLSNKLSTAIIVPHHLSSFVTLDSSQLHTHRAGSYASQNLVSSTDLLDDCGIDHDDPTRLLDLWTSI
jgi:hypothetical protein